jgi:hypothetical protein
MEATVRAAALGYALFSSFGGLAMLTAIRASLARHQVHRRSAAGLVLEIYMGERVPLASDEEARV